MTPGAQAAAGPSTNGERAAPRLSPFHLAAVTFARVAQLRSGARPRVDAAGHKPTRVALLELMADTISWKVV